MPSLWVRAMASASAAVAARTESGTCSVLVTATSWVAPAGRRVEGGRCRAALRPALRTLSTDSSEATRSPRGPIARHRDLGAERDGDEPRFTHNLRWRHDAVTPARHPPIPGIHPPWRTAG